MITSQQNTIMIITMVVGSTLSLICQVPISVKDRIRLIWRGVREAANCLVEWMFELLFIMYFVHTQCYYALQLKMTTHIFNHHNLINYRQYHYHHHHHHTFCVMYSHIQKIGFIYEVTPKTKKLTKKKTFRPKSLNPNKMKIWKCDVEKCQAYWRTKNKIFLLRMLKLMDSLFIGNCIMKLLFWLELGFLYEKDWLSVFNWEWEISFHLKDDYHLPPQCFSLF